MEDILTSEIYKHLSFEDLMYYCNTNKHYYLICQNEQVWRFLLDRDFKVIISDNNDAKSTYLLYYNALNFLSQYYEIITYNTLITFVKFILKNTWTLLGHGFAEESGEILTIYELEASIDYVISDLDYTIFEGLDEIIVKDYRDSIDFEDYKNIIKNKCTVDLLTQLITKPTYIFYNKKLKLINYDFDLAETIVYSNKFRLNHHCHNVLNFIKKDIVNLIKNKL